MYYKSYNKKYLLLFLIIIYILFIVILYKYYNQKEIEHFKSLEDSVADLFNPPSKEHTEIIYYKNNQNKNSSNNTNNKDVNKKEMKYIYVIPSNKDKYYFYNKNKQYYMSLQNDQKEKHEHKIQLYDIHNKLVGKLLIQELNQYIFKLDYIREHNYINIYFYNNYEEAKVFIDNDSEYFYVKLIKDHKFNKYNYKRNKEYEIYEYSKKIGTIDYNGKISVQEEFKKYLTMFGLTYILFSIIETH